MYPTMDRPPQCKFGPYLVFDSFALFFKISVTFLLFFDKTFYASEYRVFQK